MKTLCQTCHNDCNLPPDEQPINYPEDCRLYDEAD